MSREREPTAVRVSSTTDRQPHRDVDARDHQQDQPADGGQPDQQVAEQVLQQGPAIDVPGMRTLAQKLGVVPMALYKHVANKDDLLDGRVDLVFAEVQFPTSGADWKPAMRQRAISMRQALLRHPWAVG